MKHAVVVALMLGLGSVAGAQDLPTTDATKPPSPKLEDFMRPLIIATGLRVSVVHLNDGTVPMVFQPPTLYAMRARARQGTLFFVQGTTDNSVNNFDPARFLLEQDGRTQTSQALNIKNFVKGNVAGSQRVDGVLEFAGKLDYSKPFTVMYDGEMAAFQFTELQMLVAMPPVAQPPAQ